MVGEAVAGRSEKDVGRVITHRKQSLLSDGRSLYESARALSTYKKKASDEMQAFHGSPSSYNTKALSAFA